MTSAESLYYSRRPIYVPGWWQGLLTAQKFLLIIYLICYLFGTLTFCYTILSDLYFYHELKLLGFRTALYPMQGIPYNLSVFINVGFWENDRLTPVASRVKNLIPEVTKLFTEHEAVGYDLWKYCSRVFYRSRAFWASAFTLLTIGLVMLYSSLFLCIFTRRLTIHVCNLSTVVLLSAFALLYAASVEYNNCIRARQFQLVRPGKRLQVFINVGFWENDRLTPVASRVKNLIPEVTKLFTEHEAVGYDLWKYCSRVFYRSRAFWASAFTLLTIGLVMLYSSLFLCIFTRRLTIHVCNLSTVVLLSAFALLYAASVEYNNCIRARQFQLVRPGKRLQVFINVGFWENDRLTPVASRVKNLIPEVTKLFTEHEAVGYDLWKYCSRVFYRSRAFWASAFTLLTIGLVMLYSSLFLCIFTRRLTIHVCNLSTVVLLSAFALLYAASVEYNNCIRARQFQLVRPGKRLQVSYRGRFFSVTTKYNEQQIYRLLTASLIGFIPMDICGLVLLYRYPESL